MLIEEAKVLLGFPADSRPTLSQVKAAYREKVWETHPDRFPPNLKAGAESKFKSISEAYDMCLILDGTRRRNLNGYYSTPNVVVRTYGGVSKGAGGRGIRYHAFVIGVPFFFIIAGTAALGLSFAARAYKRQKDAYPSHNPFLP